MCTTNHFFTLSHLAYLTYKIRNGKTKYMKINKEPLEAIYQNKYVTTLISYQGKYNKNVLVLTIMHPAVTETEKKTKFYLLLPN